MPSDPHTAIQSLQASAASPGSEAMSEVLQILHSVADPRVYVRDAIIVDEAFVKRLQAIAAGFAKGTTLKLAARTIEHKQGLVLKIEGYPLVIAADVYEGNGGAIDTSGSNGAAGKTWIQGLSGESALQLHTRRSRRDWQHWPARCLGLPDHPGCVHRPQPTPDRGWRRRRARRARRRRRRRCRGQVRQGRTLRQQGGIGRRRQRRRRRRRRSANAALHRC